MAIAGGIDRERSAARIERDIEHLATADYTVSSEAIRRYAYTQAYRNTLDYFARELERIGFDVSEDAVGTLVARNRPAGEPAFGVGSHCDSNRNGGKYDGTMGVVTALEVCRLNEELGLGLPLQLISFLEEEGSGFGQMLLGSRIVAQRVTEEDLRERFLATDDGRSFWEHAEDAGYEPARWRECARVLDGLTGWIEMHIEQARVLQDTGNRIGIVEAIAGYVHADVFVHGRGDHAGATPMDFRLDPDTGAGGDGRRAGAARAGRRARHGRHHRRDRGRPGADQRDRERVRFSLDIRGPDDEVYRSVAREIAAYVVQAAERRGMRAEYTERQTLAATPMDERIVGALEQAAARDGRAVPADALGSGPRHDVRRRPRPDRDGLRPLQGRDQPPPGRARGARGRGARRRDHADGDRVAAVAARPEPHGAREQEEGAEPQPATTTNPVRPPPGSANERPSSGVPTRATTLAAPLTSPTAAAEASGRASAAPVNAGANGIPAARPTSAAPTDDERGRFRRCEQQRARRTGEQAGADRGAHPLRPGVQDPAAERPGDDPERERQRADRAGAALFEPAGAVEQRHDPVPDHDAEAERGCVEDGERVEPRVAQDPRAAPAARRAFRVGVRRQGSPPGRGDPRAPRRATSRRGRATRSSPRPAARPRAQAHLRRARRRRKGPARRVSLPATGHRRCLRRRRAPCRRRSGRASRASAQCRARSARSR